MTTAISTTLLDHFAALPDPQQHAKVLYPLPEILLVVLSSTIAGADDFVETTLCDVFAALDPELFKACFLAWISDLRDGDREIIAIDGKTSRRSHDKRKGARAATPCISSPPGRRANRSSLASRRPRKSLMKSPPFRCCLSTSS
jgi:hypothetical protein